MKKAIVHYLVSSSLKGGTSHMLLNSVD